MFSISSFIWLYFRAFSTLILKKLGKSPRNRSSKNLIQISTSLCLQIFRLSCDTPQQSATETEVVLLQPFHAIILKYLQLIEIDQSLSPFTAFQIICNSYDSAVHFALFYDVDHTDTAERPRSVFYYDNSRFF